MPKITLFALNSSYSHTNLAVRCIRKSLAAAGFSAEILEFSQKDKRRHVLSALYESAADIYGFSAYIWNIRELLAFASDLKRLRPDAFIVFGGPEVSFDAEEILAKNPFIDCIITGEGEAAFCELAAKFDAGQPIPRIIVGGTFDAFADAGSLYDSVDGSGRLVYYESSRGCPFRCAYCLSAMSGSVRAKSAEQTLAELADFEHMDGIRVIKFVDRTFNFDRERAKAIWRGLLSDAFTKHYHFEICADLLDEESFSLLSQFPAGKIQLEIGVQSTNPETLRRVNRSPETERLLEAITRLHAMGNMHIHADLIAGLPGEDLASFARSYDALYGRCDMLQLGFLKLLRGSVLRAHAAEFGCVYSAEPPYEVLATDCLDFSELCLLHDIDGLTDRLANSGVFSRSLVLLATRYDSPFSMFCELAAYLRAHEWTLDAMAQPRLYEAIYDCFHAGGDVQLAERLILDFLTSQKLSPPKIGGVTLALLGDDTKRAFMRFADEREIAYFAPALEARAGSAVYIIDRRMQRAYVKNGDAFVEI